VTPTFKTKSKLHCPTLQRYLRSFPSADPRTKAGGDSHTDLPVTTTLPPRYSSGTELTFIWKRIECLLERISDCNLPDVAPGSDITPEGLRSVRDTHVLSVRGYVKECKDHLSTYAALPGADAQLIQAALIKCQHAEAWCDKVVSGYRSVQLQLTHLRDETTPLVPVIMVDAVNSVASSTGSDYLTSPMLGAGQVRSETKWSLLVRQTINIAETQVLSYRGKQVPINTALHVRFTADRIGQDLTALLPYSNSVLRDRIRSCILDMDMVCTDIYDRCKKEWLALCATSKLSRIASRSSNDMVSPTTAVDGPPMGGVQIFVEETVRSCDTSVGNRVSFCNAAPPNKVPQTVQFNVMDPTVGGSHISAMATTFSSDNCNTLTVALPRVLQSLQFASGDAPLVARGQHPIKESLPCIQQGSSDNTHLTERLFQPPNASSLVSTPRRLLEEDDTAIFSPEFDLGGAVRDMMAASESCQHLLHPLSHSEAEKPVWFSLEGGDVIVQETGHDVSPDSAPCHLLAHASSKQGGEHVAVTLLLEKVIVGLLLLTSPLRYKFAVLLHIAARPTLRSVALEPEPFAPQLRVLAHSNADSSEQLVKLLGSYASNFPAHGFDPGGAAPHETAVAYRPQFQPPVSRAEKCTFKHRPHPSAGQFRKQRCRQQFL
jgi:hypothetical protein